MEILKVEQWMTKNVITVNRDCNSALIAELMKNNNIGSLVVVNNNQPVGIVTERDLVRKVMARHRDPHQTIVEDIMSMNVITVDTGMQIKDVSRRMVKYNIKKMPVVNDGNLVGIITTTDIVKILAQLNKLYDAKEILEMGV